jgi:hypothetical protein
MLPKGENLRSQRKPYSIAILSTKNPTWADPGANSGIRGEATNRSGVHSGSKKCKRGYGDAYGSV